MFKRTLFIALALALLAGGTAETLALTGSDTSASRNINAAATQYIPGPQGPPGPEGDQGPQGQQGQNGRDGRDGQNGQNGQQGQQGQNGRDGQNVNNSNSNSNSKFHCVSTRRFQMHLYTGKYRVRNAQVQLGSDNLHVLNKHSRRPMVVVDLRGRSLDIARVKVTLRLSNGRRVSFTRSFLTCGK